MRPPPPRTIRAIVCLTVALVTLTADATASLTPEFAPTTTVTAAATPDLPALNDTVSPVGTAVEQLRPWVTSMLSAVNSLQSAYEALGRAFVSSQARTGPGLAGQRLGKDAKLDSWSRKRVDTTIVRNFQPALQRMSADATGQLSRGIRGAADSALFQRHVSLHKRQLAATDNGNSSTEQVCSGVGRQTLVLTSAYNCSGVIYPDYAFDSPNATQVRCSDCQQQPGATSTVALSSPVPLPTLSQPNTNSFNQTLANSPDCAANCCKPAASPVETLGCACPADRYGSRCQLVRGFGCTIDTSRLENLCSRPDADVDTKARIYTDPNCRKFSVQDTEIQVPLRLQCSMSQPVTRSADNINNFQYFVDGARATAPQTGNYSSAQLLLSLDPGLFVQLMAFNFYRLSDVAMADYVGPLTAAQLLGQQDVPFTVNASLMHSLTNRTAFTNYLAGGRMYLEATLAALKPVPGIQSVPYGRIYLDFVDGSGRSAGQQLADHSRVTIGVSVGVVLVLLAGCAVAVFLYTRRRQRTKPKLA